LAPNTDANLKNPWGASFSPTSPFWVSNQVSGNSTLYSASGAAVPLIVATPPGSPTGQVFNSTTQFALNGKPSSFIFDTLGGTVDAWNGGSAATVMATTAGAAYTGLALASVGSNNYLYAANTAQGRIDVYDSSFKPATLSGTFSDPNLPAGYTPYNIQAIGGDLYVEYSKGFQTGSGLGIVDKFNANGTLIQRVVTGGVLNAPWGVTLAPAGFGTFGGDLLIGNFGNGEINAFDPATGTFLGTLLDQHGNPIVNDGLWSLSFRTGGGFNTEALYFTAGINGQKDGLFGSIVATPEPGTFLIGAFGLLAIVLFNNRRMVRTRS
jgi:uncharacterized protein (TIGR03118 family)